MRDTDSEHVWSKPGPRFRLPRAPRVSLKTLLIVAPLLAATAFAMVGFVAAPAGSPKSPPPPAVAAEPLSSLISAPTETPTPTYTPTPEASPVEAIPPEPPPPHCRPTPHATGAIAARGTVLFSDLDVQRLSLFDPRTKKRTVLLDGKEGCGFLDPRFIDDHTVSLVVWSEYPKETGAALLDLESGALRRLARGTQKWDWIATVALSPDASKLAELGGIGGEQPYTLRVTSTYSGRVLFTKKLGQICYCDGTPTPPDLQWSPDSTVLLAAVPLADGSGLWAFNRDGSNVRAPTKAAYPRWIGASRAFIYMDADGDWQRVDGLYAKPTFLFSTKRGLGEPAFSPDRTKIAFWDNNDLSLIVFDSATNKLTVLAKMRISPVWLDDHTLLSNGVEYCNCEGFGFTGVSWSTSLATGRTVKLGSFGWSVADVLR